VSSVELLKVSAWSNPKSVAGAIAGVLRERGFVDVQVIGAAALNQAVKAIAISRSYTAAEGIDPICVPAFQDIEINGEGRTAIRIRVEDRAGGRRMESVRSTGEDTEASEDQDEPAL
jgi:stage V sporulation protein S